MVNYDGFSTKAFYQLLLTEIIGLLKLSIDKESFYFSCVYEEFNQCEDLLVNKGHSSSFDGVYTHHRWSQKKKKLGSTTIYKHKH